MMIEEIGIEVKPLRKRVLLRREGEVEEETSGGIHLPDLAIKPPQTAMILEKGSDVSEDIELNRLAVVPQWAGTEVMISDNWYLLLEEEDIMAYVD
jgi:co-chaperonin GroES (HSP10)|tara:strand:- start:5690 stop:5977 length:288 start_codon:yes stop_codon:yes gene_type:complete